MLTQYYVNKNTLKCPLNTITSKLPEKFHTYLFVLVLRVLFHSWESTRLSRVTGSDRGLDAEIRAQLASRSCTAPDYAASSASPFRTHRSHWHLDFIHRFHLESLWFRTIRRHIFRRIVNLRWQMASSGSGPAHSTFEQYIRATVYYTVHTILTSEILTNGIW